MNENDIQDGGARILRACCEIVGAAYGRKGAPVCYSMPYPTELGRADAVGELPTLIYSAPELSDGEGRRAWAARRPFSLKFGTMGGRICAEDNAAWRFATATVAEKELKRYLNGLRQAYTSDVGTCTAEGITDPEKAVRDA